MMVPASAGFSIYQEILVKIAISIFFGILTVLSNPTFPGLSQGKS